MRFNPVLTTLLCIITWMSSVHATQGPMSSCCPGWSTTRIQVKDVMNYTIQSEGVCTIKAVVFKTRYGKTICSNPNSEWAKRAMAKVDEEAKGLQGMGFTEQASTSGVTPAPTISIKVQGKESERKRRRRGMKNKPRRRGKGQRKCV